MTALKFRAPALTIAALQFALSLFLFATVQEAGSAYLMLRRAHGAGAEFPLLTERVALPLLRIAAPDPHNRPVTLWWVWLVWGAVLAAPVATAIATMKASTIESAARRFSLGSSLWVTLLLAVAALVVIGCALGGACM